MITELQREARRRGLGGSDIAGILNLSPWSTPVSVWLEKMGMSLPRSESEAMWWGTYEEDLVARRFTELTGRKTVRHNATIEDGVLLANLDRLVIPKDGGVAAFKGAIRTDAILEAKTTGSEWPEAEAVETLPNGYEVMDGDKGVPAYYQCQCNHYLGRVPTAERIYVAVKMSIPCRGYSRTKFGVYAIRRDDAIIAAQDEYAREWWERHVVGNLAPDATNEDDAKRIWRVSSPKTYITATDEILAAHARLKKATADIEKAEAEASAAKAEIENAMRDSETLLAADGKTVLATWKTSKGRTVTTTDWEGVAKELASRVEGGEAVLDAEAAKRTTTEEKPGRRTFLAKFAKEAS